MFRKLIDQNVQIHESGYYLCFSGNRRHYSLLVTDGEFLYREIPALSREYLLPSDLPEEELEFDLLWEGKLEGATTFFFRSGPEDFQLYGFSLSFESRKKICYMTFGGDLNTVSEEVLWRNMEFTSSGYEEVSVRRIGSHVREVFLYGGDYCPTLNG